MKKILSAVLLPALKGTASMTLFSYLLSDLCKKNFKEPVLLGLLLRKRRKGIAENAALPIKHHLAGWLLHYIAGLAWTVLVHALDSRRGEPPGRFLTGIYGIGCGLVSIGVWNRLLNAHPDPPRIDRAAFYMQLLPAHLIFIGSLEQHRRLALDIF